MKCNEQNAIQMDPSNEAASNVPPAGQVGTGSGANPQERTQSTSTRTASISQSAFASQPASQSMSSTPSILSGLLTLSPKNNLVAIRADGTVMTDRAFLIEVARWRDLFLAARSRTTSCCRRTRVVIHSADTTALLPALFGAWSAGVETVLAGDALPGTLERMRSAAIVEPGTDLLALDMAAFAEEASIGLTAVEAPQPVDSNTALTTPVPMMGPLADDAVLCSLFTSGSTGEAKRVPKRLGQLFFETEGVQRAFHEAGLTFDEPTVAVSTVTAQHIYGILFRALLPLIEPHLMADSPRTHFPEALAERMAMFARDGKKILLVSSPAHLSRFTEPKLFKASRSAVVGVSSSAGPLSAEAARYARLAFGHWPLEVLGSTETGGIARRRRAFENPADEARADACIHQSPEDADPAALQQMPVRTPAWRPMPGVEVAISPLSAESADTSISHSNGVLSAAILNEGIGRIALKARHLADRGWTVGDDNIRLEIDATGPFFTLLGRADRIAKIEGKRVALAEVESLLLADGQFEAVKVLAVQRGEELFHTPGIPAAPAQRDELAVVLVPKAEVKDELLRYGKNKTLARIRAQLLKTLSPVLVPKRWRFVDRLPANAQGKTTRTALAALFDPRRPEWLLTKDEKTEGAEGQRTFEIDMRLSPNLVWFRGHFPDLPILPGVAQLLLVERALREFASEDPLVAARFSAGPTNVKNLKFKAITHPGMRLRLRLTIPRLSSASSDPATAPLKVKFEWLRVENSGNTEETFPHSLGVLEFPPA